MMHSKNIFRAARAQLSFYLGGDASENGDFQMGKQRCRGTKFFRAFIFLNQILYKCLKTYGGDVTKNRDFIEGKMVAHGQFFNF